MVSPSFSLTSDTPEIAYAGSKYFSTQGIVFFYFLNLYAATEPHCLYLL